MKAMRLHAAGTPLRMDEVPAEEPARGQLLLRVTACGVCRTDLHIVDGELAAAPYPITPGHEVVGIVEAGGTRDGMRFMEVVSRTPIHTQTTPYPLESANQALADLRSGRLTGAAVLLP